MAETSGPYMHASRYCKYLCPTRGGGGGGGGAATDKHYWDCCGLCIMPHKSLLLSFPIAKNLYSQMKTSGGVGGGGSFVLSVRFLSSMAETFSASTPPISCGLPCALFVYLVGQRCFLDAWRLWRTAPTVMFGFGGLALLWFLELVGKNKGVGGAGGERL